MDKKKKTSAHVWILKFNDIHVIITHRTCAGHTHAHIKI